MKSLKIYMIALLALIITGCGAQKEFDPEYVKVTNERAQKIVDEMELGSAEKELKVRDLIAEQYRNLSWIQDGRDAKVEKINKNTQLSDEEKEKKKNEIREEADEEIAELHEDYLEDLNEELTAEQVIAVKDGMTYHVAPNTYIAFLDMLPQLTEEEKEFIHRNLVEAREHAMDAGSSHQKHWWFGKYKGKINNYLSDRGYDLKKASKEWHKRLEERKNNGNK